MKRVRVIPVLLLHQGGLYKTKKFADAKYVGDPINAVKIFNEKEVDELVVLDIDATVSNRTPDLGAIEQIVAEAFMPVAYGGGIQTIDQIRELMRLGIEKVILNSVAFRDPSLITKAANELGSQSVVVSVDYKKDLLGRKRVVLPGGIKTGKSVLPYLEELQNAGAGEIILSCIDREGTYEGYDTEMLKMASEKLRIPVVAQGGASSVGDFLAAVKSGASAVAAGSMFVFQRPHQAVLITYPAQQQLKEQLFSRI